MLYTEVRQSWDMPRARVSCLLAMESAVAFVLIRIVLFRCDVFQESCNSENKGHAGGILVKLESF